MWCSSKLVPLVFGKFLLTLLFFSLQFSEFLWVLELKSLIIEGENFTSPASGFGLSDDLN
jgi:hypothetical protein